MGHGAFGIVRVCQDKDGEKFAVKLIDKQSIDQSKTYTELLRNEMDILMSVKHSKCMNTIELVEDYRNYYVITEIIEGGPVMNRLKDMTRPFKEN